MSNVTDFPAFIRAAYDEGDAFSRFQRDVQNATSNAERQFDQFSKNAQRQLTQALTLPRTSGGALNLGVAEAQAAARAADERAAAAREMANAVRLAAAAEGDYSQSARLSIAAAEALANDERQAAQAARDHAAAVAQVQAQLDRHAVAINNSANVTRLHTDATGAQRAAMINASQQLQDVTVQLASGQRASVVFAQQLPQLGFALSGLEGSTNKTAARLGALGTFLAGPWGVAVFAGVTALGFLMESLSRTSDRLDETASAAEKSAGRIRSALENLQAYGQTASEMSKLFTDSSDVRISAAKKDAQAARLELDAQQARQTATQRGIGIDREYRQAALRRAESAEARAKALRNEANADRASAEATLKAAAQKERAQAVIDGMNATATGGARRGGGATVDREARAAAKEIDQLESKIQSLESRLDPAASAAREFADALEAINQAAGKGIISTGRAQELSTFAIFEEDRRRRAQESADVAAFMQRYTPVDLSGIVESSEAYSRRLEEKWKAAQEGAANAFAESLANVDILRGLFSGRGIKSMITSPDPQRMATGSDTFIGSLLYGRKTLAEGQDRMGLAQAYQQSLRAFERGLDDILKEVFGEDASKLGEVIGNAILGAQMGSFGAGITGGNRTAGALGGVLGSEVGKSLAKGPLGTALGKFSSALGPLGGIVGGIALGALGSALTPAKRGSATIGGTGATLAIASTRGNSRSRIAQSSDSAGEAITTLERIAEALGGTIDASRGAVSIGVRDKNFRVDTSGQGITKTKRGAIDFGQDSAAAIKFATMDLIKDGVIVGLRASTQRLLQNAKDLDDALRKATDFQSVFDRLQERLDPVAAAITGIEREFTRLRNIFAEAGASAEEYADLEKLYQLERTEAIKEANERVLGSMKALLDDLRFGDNGRSLRDRLAAAQAKFDPLAARVEAGDKTAYDDFAEAARTILDIQRQFSGSQTAFFALQDRITTLTAKAVEGGNVTSILTGGSSVPSAQADAQRAFEAAPIVDAIGQQTTDLINGIVSGLGRELRDIRVAVSGGGGRSDIPGFFAQEVRQI